MATTTSGHGASLRSSGRPSRPSASSPSTRSSSRKPAPPPRPGRRIRSPTCSPGSVPTDCWGLCGSTSTGSGTGGSTLRLPPRRITARRRRAAGCARGRAGLHRRATQPRSRSRLSAATRLVLMIVPVATAVAIFVAVTAAAPSERSGGPSGGLSVEPGSYLGVYVTGIPHSYQPVREFVGATGVRPNLLLYYSAWWEPFRARFAATAARHGAVPLVQINPAHVGLAAIAAGQYDSYLDRFAAEVSAYRRPG